MKQYSDMQLINVGWMSRLTLAVRRAIILEKSPMKGDVFINVMLRAVVSNNR